MKTVILKLGTFVLNGVMRRKESIKLLEIMDKGVEAYISSMLSHIYPVQELRDAVFGYKQKIAGELSAVFLMWAAIALLMLEYTVFLFGFGGCAAIILFLTDRDMKNKITERTRDIVRLLPDFITRMVLLLEAGMTLYRAFELSGKKIAHDSALYKEVKYCCMEINRGMSEQDGYEMLSSRCRVIEVSRFSSILVQNLKKGNREVSAMLRLISVECWEARKIQTKGKGEEMSIKLLMPMTVLLIAIMLLTIAPAIMIFFSAEI